MAGYEQLSREELLALLAEREARIAGLDAAGSAGAADLKELGQFVDAAVE